MWATLPQRVSAQWQEGEAPVGNLVGTVDYHGREFLIETKAELVAKQCVRGLHTQERHVFAMGQSSITPGAAAPNNFNMARTSPFRALTRNRLSQ